MQNIASRATGAFLLAALFSILSGFTFSERFGVDTYEIYLNNELQMRNSLDKPLSLKNLKLTRANENDQLVIRYRECHAPKSGPTDRVVSLRNEAGKVVKEWNFSSGENNAPMSIPVKEILAAQKQSGETLLLAYSSGNLGRVQNLAAL
jgi:hypothetical protein